MKLSSFLLALSVPAIAVNAIAAEPAPVTDVTNLTTNLTTNIKATPLSLSERVAILERKLEARNRMQTQVNDIQQELNELRGITELHTHKLSQILARQRELYQELDRRVSEALKPTNQATSTIATMNSLGAVQQNYSNDLTENQAYDQAVNMVLKDKRYEQAIPAFRQFNQQYPQSSYAANAHYWLGQLLFNKNELVEAKKEFTIVVEQFDQSTKRSDAMLKLAMVEQKQNNTNKATSWYQQLISSYPNSSAAKLAQARLKTL
jgi:tol-pal system protein YbgF